MGSELVALLSKFGLKERSFKSGLKSLLRQENLVKLIFENLKALAVLKSQNIFTPIPAIAGAIVEGVLIQYLLRTKKISNDDIKFEDAIDKIKKDALCTGLIESSSNISRELRNSIHLFEMLKNPVEMTKAEFAIDAMFILLKDIINVPVSVPLLAGSVDFAKEKTRVVDEVDFIHSKEGAISVWVKINDLKKVNDELNNRNSNYSCVFGTSKKKNALAWANFFSLRYCRNQKKPIWHFIVADNNVHMNKNNKRTANQEVLKIEQKKIGQGWRMFVIRWKVVKGKRDVNLIVYNKNNGVMDREAKKIEIWPKELGKKYILVTGRKRRMRTEDLRYHRCAFTTNG